MDILVKAGQLILSLSILVILHEFGHYIPAKLFKTRVEKFYLFFAPWFSLFKKKVGETEWGIGWIPLGGYVKIAGMVDESMDTEQLKQPAQDWEFRSKKAWQRLIIMAGGIIVNVIVGFTIYIFLVFGYGEEVLAPKDLKQGMAVHPYMQKYGIESGDNVLAIDGIELENINEANTIILLRNGRNLKIKKANGDIKNVMLPEDIDFELFENGAASAFSPRMKRVKIESFENDAPIKKLKVKLNDEIIAVNGKSITFYDEFQKETYIGEKKPIRLTFKRGNETFEKTIKLPKEGKYKGKFGFLASTEDLIDKSKIKQINYSFGESIARGIKKGKNTLSDYVSQFKFFFTKKGASSLGGVASMGKLFPSVWDWEIFWTTTAFFSMALAFMNLLPIPALDGGHIVFLIYEIIVGKEAPQKILEYAQITGIVILLSLMAFANGNDIYRWLTGAF